MNNKRKGISLIVLVITIIVMIILASAIILALSGNGVIFKTNKAKFQNDMATMKEELSVYISNKEVETNGAYNSDNLSATKDSLVEEGTTIEGKTILDIIKSMDKKYIGKIEIVNGKLRYSGSNIDEIKWSDEILEGIKGNNLEEVKVEQSNTIKLEDSVNTSFANYRIYGNTEEYQQVEYIESNGTQYIDTGYVPSSSLKLDLEFSCTNIEQGFNIGWGSSGYQEIFECGVNSELGFYFGVNNDCTRTQTGISADLDKHIFSIKSGEQKLDGVAYGSTAIGNTAGGGQTMYLFKRHIEWDSSGVDSGKGCGRIYSCKMWDNESLVRDYIPCYRKSDGAIGLYDKVSDSFFENIGTGKFEKGNNIINQELGGKGSLGDYVVDMNFDNKWKQGSTYGNDGDSYYNIRVICKNFIKSETGTKYLVSSNLPDNMQIAVANGTFTTSPATQALTAYDSGWQDDDFTFTSTVDGSILIAIRYKDDSNITPEDIANYEIKVEKYTSETEDGGVYVIPINIKGKNLLDIDKGLNNVLIKNSDDTYTLKKANESQRFSLEIPMFIPANTEVSIDADILDFSVTSANSERERLPGQVFFDDGTFDYMTFYGGEEKRIYKKNIVKIKLYMMIEWQTNSYIKFKNMQVEFGNVATNYEPYVEPKTFNIYLDEPLRRIGNYADYIDFRSQEIVRNVEVVDGVGGQQTLRGLDTPVREKITIPDVMLHEGTNIIEVLTKAQPSKIETLYYKK